MWIMHDNQSKFDDQLKKMSRKISKTIGFPGKWQNLLLRAALIKTYKAFITHHRGILDYQAYNVFSPKAGLHSL